MKKYIIVNTQGAVVSVQQPAFDNQIIEGWEEGMYTKEVSPSMSTQELLTDFYWDFENSALVSYPTPRPGAYFYWENNQWERYDNEYLKALKASRTQKLVASDWTQMPDSPLTLEQKVEWATYRQALRDLPDNLTGNEVSVEDAPWPVAP